MTFMLPPLPYALDALEPVISKNTMDFHYHKHHRGYVDKLNELIPGSDYEGASLDEVLLESRDANKIVYNNAAQAWNHTFFWKCMTPNKPKMSKAFKAALQRDIGNDDELKEHFIKAGTEHFGSGYVWLVQTAEGHLKIRTLSNAVNPMNDQQKPLLCCDLWEHAYYLDYQNERTKFLQQFWTIINWDFVEANFNQTLPVARSGRSAILFDEKLI